MPLSTFQLAFDYFDAENIDVEPTQEELNALARQTQLFYTSTIANVFQNFVQLYLDINGITFDDDQPTLPTSIQWNISTLFYHYNPDSNSETISAETVLAIMGGDMIIPVTPETVLATMEGNGTIPVFLFAAWSLVALSHSLLVAIFC